MNDRNTNIFYAVTACVTLIIISYNAVRTETVEVVKTETVEIVKEVPVDRIVSECESFDAAFKTNRELLGKHETFFWNGEEYNLYHKEEIRWEQ